MKDETEDQPVVKVIQQLAADEHRLYADEAPACPQIVLRSSG